MSRVIQIDDLSRKFGQKQALSGVSLSIPEGCVYGLVGENGAGKTTLLKHLLGLLRPQSGSVSVFGLDPIAHPIEVLGRIGYLSEDRALPGWMSVQEVIGYTAAFYPKWDDRYAMELREMFELSPSQKLKSLSRGQKARVGLLLALAYRPPLLVLDEPSSGLDAVVRRDILAAIIRTVADEGRTVLFSSHLLDEVQRVSDRFAMIHHGKVLLSGGMDEVLDRHVQLTVRFESPQDRSPDIPGAQFVSGEGREWSLLCNGDRDSVAATLQQSGAEIVERRRPTLEELFVTRSKTQSGSASSSGTTSESNTSEGANQ